MKPGPTPTPPDDETPDPLLTTLRQRLGDYGAAPPPAAWAAIRQRVAAPPLPWWRRPQRLLPLLALLLGLVLVGTLAVRRSQLAGKQPVAHREASASAAEHRTLANNNLLNDTVFGRSATNDSNQPNNSLEPTTPGQPAATSPNHPLAATLPMATDAAARRATAAARRLAPVVSATTLAGQRGTKASAASSVAGRLAAPQRHSASNDAAGTQKRKAAFAIAGNRSRRRAPETSALRAVEHEASSAHEATSAHKAEYASRRKAIATALRAATMRAASRRAITRLAGGRSLPSAQQTTRKATVAAGEAGAATRLTRTLTGTQQTRSQFIAATPTSPHRSRRSRAAHRAGLPARLPGAAAGVPEPTTALGYAPAAQPAGLQPPLFVERGAAIDLLALKQADLLLPEAARPTIPAARPDSMPPAHAVRRWSVLVLAGPTLSYRTLGPAPTLAAGHPDFARLERPALGLGAQVQVRRVLSGRWALAVGVGYHEYATRLALSVKDSTTIRQRDTYRLLTLPVQFTYALGAPRGRLALGLLLGVEPGWYLGGRSTEGSDCGCQQRVYPADSAQTSPYRPWSLAFSLGLDVRYRLGGPTSRWHLVVQPTGRYVATPFVRSDAVGFTPRQPISLGLLTGFSWDLR